MKVLKSLQIRTHSKEGVPRASLCVVGLDGAATAQVGVELDGTHGSAEHIDIAQADNLAVLQEALDGVEAGLELLDQLERG